MKGIQVAIDLSEFRESERPNKCAITHRIASLSDDERETLAEALAEPDITTASIYRWLNKRNVKVNWNTVDRHRKGECRCGKSK